MWEAVSPEHAHHALEDTHIGRMELPDGRGNSCDGAARPERPILGYGSRIFYPVKSANFTGGHKYKWVLSARIYLSGISLQIKEFLV